MNTPERTERPAPAPSEYILDNFEPGDRIAVLVLNRQIRETTQRITTAEKAASQEFQAWLRYKNANGADIYVGMNALKRHASTRTKDDIEGISHVYLDLDYGGTSSTRIQAANRLPRCTPESRAPTQTVRLRRPFEPVGARLVLRKTGADQGRRS